MNKQTEPNKPMNEEQRLRALSLMDEVAKQMAEGVIEQMDVRERRRSCEYESRCGILEFTVMRHREGKYEWEFQLHGFDVTRVLGASENYEKDQ